MSNILNRRFIKYGLSAMVVAGVIASLSISLASMGKDAENGTSQFCLSCHEMKNTVYKEYQKSSHYRNPSGMRASCKECHVPSDILPSMIRKVKAGREVLAKIKGTIDTPEKFEKKRLTLAKLVWADMEANNSRECRTCHLTDGFDFTKFKNQDSAKQMEKGLKEGQTCINCHKGIAHEMPDISSGYKAKYEELEALSLKEKNKKGSTFTLETKPFFLKQKDSKKAGKILPGTELTILKRKGDKLKVRINGWQQEGVAPMIYALQGKRIFSAALGKKAQPEVKVLKTVMDEDTDLNWNQVTLTCWITSDNLLSEQEKLWEYGAEMHSASCSPCHSATPANHFLANQWMGSLKAMSRNTNLDKGEYRFLLKYLQFHARDTKGGHH